MNPTVLAPDEHSHLKTAGALLEEFLSEGSPYLPLGHGLARTSCYSNASRHSKASAGSLVPDVSLSSCMITLTKTILGSGMLGLPYLCHVNGIGLFALLLLGFAGLNAYTMCLLVWATDLTPHPGRDMDFGTLGRLACGDFGLRAVQVIIGVDLWGTLVAYMVVTADILQPAIDVFTAGSAPVWLIGRGPVILLTSLAVLPPCTWRSIAALSSAAVVGMVALTAFALYLAFQCATTDFAGHLRHVTLWRPGLDALRSLPVLAFVYNAHFNVFSIYTSLARPSPRRMGAVIVGACGLSSLFNLLVAAAGYILFLRHAQANVLQNLPLDDYPAVAVRSLFGFALALTYPIVAFELRQMIERLILGKTAGRATRTAIAAIAVLTSAVTAIAVPNVTVAFGLVGGTTTTAMAFVLPPLFFLRLYAAASPTAGWRRWLAVVPAALTLCLGLVAVPAFTYLTIEEALGPAG